MMTALERFNRNWKVDNDGCHIWQGKPNGSNGYGRFGVNGKMWLAHRWIFLQAHGYLPPAVCHSCDKPLCVREQCLFPGTQLDNIADRHTKGRSSAPNRDNHGTAKLTSQQVDEIRTIYSQGGVTQKELGKIYGLGQTGISAIVRK